MWSDCDLVWLVVHDDIWRVFIKKKKLKENESVSLQLPGFTVEIHHTVYCKAYVSAKGQISFMEENYVVSNFMVIWFSAHTVNYFIGEQDTRFKADWGIGVGLHQVSRRYTIQEAKELVSKTKTQRHRDRWDGDANKERGLNLDFGPKKHQETRGGTHQAEADD